MVRQPFLRKASKMVSYRLKQEIPHYFKRMQLAYIGPEQAYGATRLAASSSA